MASDETRVGRPPAEGPPEARVVTTIQVATVPQFKSTIHGGLTAQGFTLAAAGEALGVPVQTVRRAISAEDVDLVSVLPLLDLARVDLGDIIDPDGAAEAIYAIGALFLQACAWYGLEPTDELGRLVDDE